MNKAHPEPSQPVDGKLTGSAAFDALYQKADGFLRDPGNNAPPWNGDLADLIHELQVYHVEMEMQNEELKKAQEELALLNQRFSDLYDYAPAGYLSLDDELVVREANLTLASILARKRGDIIGRHFSSFIYEPDMDVFSLLTGSLSLGADNRTCEVRLNKPDGSTRWVRLDGSVIAGKSTRREIWLTVIDIEERKQAEEELRRSEEKWHSLFEILPLGVSIINNGRDLIEFNPALGSILDITEEGLRRGDYTRRGYYGRDGKALAPHEMPSHRALKEGVITKDFEIQVEKENGERVWTSVSAAPLSVEKSAVVVTRDISEQKKAQQEVERSNLKFTSLFQNSPLAISLIDASTGEIVDINQAFVESFAYSREEVIGKTMRDLNIYPDEPTRSKIIGRVREEGLALDRVVRLRTKASGEKYFSVTVKSLEIGDEHLLLTMALDITRRMHIEKELRERERFITSVADITPAIVFVYDFDSGKNIFVNRGMETILGFTQDELRVIGSRLVKEFIHPEDMGRYLKFQTEMLQAGDGQVLENEYRSKHKDGSWRVLHTFETPFMRNQQGKLTQKMGIAVDITAIKKKEELIQEQLRQIQEMAAHVTDLDEMEKKVLARELHDSLGNNMAALSMHFKMIMERLPSELRGELTNQEEDINLLLQNSNESIRNLMRSLRPGIVEDEGIVSALSWYGQVCAKRAGFKFEMEAKEPEPDLPMETLIAVFRVMQEALNNSVKHAGARNVKIYIEKKESHYHFIAEDDGAGFTPSDDEQSAMLQGWGLLIMRERIAAIGGELEIASSPGLGARITVRVKV